MSKQTEALKLALEALNMTDSEYGSRAWEREHEAITAIREALAEQPAEAPAQRKLTWFEDKSRQQAPWTPGEVAELKSVLEKYLQPAQEPWPEEPAGHMAGMVQPAQQQEPVAVKQIAEALRKHGLTLVKTAHSYHVMDLVRIEAQTTSPQPSKPWVGLTDEERTEIVQQRRLNVGDWNINGEGIAKAIEANLREKNAQPSKPLTPDDVRRAGGIVHSDGNIFFTNIEKLNACIGIKGDA